MTKDQSSLLVSKVKDLLVEANAGNEIAEPLQQLELAMQLAEPGWNVSRETAERLSKTKDYEEAL